MILARLLQKRGGVKVQLARGMLGGSTGKWAELVQVPESCQIGPREECGLRVVVRWGRIELC